MSDMVIRITLDAAQLKKELGLTQDELKRVDGKELNVKTDSAQSGIAKLRDSIAMWGLALNGAITAAKGLASAVNSVVAPALEQEKAALDLAAALKNTGVYSAQLESRLLAQASAIQAVTTYGDDAILMATRQMQVIGQLSSDQLPAAQKAAVGLAAAYKLDLTTAFEMVGKAAAGNTATLSRYGIVLDEGLAPNEKFNELLRIGAERFELAREEANTTAGALAQMNNLWGDLKEVIGTWILPLLGDVSTAFADVLKWIQGISNNQKQAEKSAADLASQFEFLTGKVLEYKGQTTLTAQEQEEFNGFIQELKQEFPEYFDGMDIMAMKYADVATAISNARNEIELLMDRMVLQAVIDDYSDDLIKVGKKIRTAQEELQKYQKMQAEGDEWVVVGPDMIRSVKMYINKYNDEIERFRKKKAEIIRERDAIAAELNVLPTPKTAPTPVKKPDPANPLVPVAPGTPASAAVKEEISETAKAYEELLLALQKYHDERSLIGMTAHQKKLAELSNQFDAEQQIVLDALAAQEISEEEASIRLADIRARFDAEAQSTKIAADNELIRLSRERLDRSVQDEEAYYETMRFADEDYYEWKVEQIRKEVEAMAIGDEAKMALIQQHLAELDALKAEFEQEETKSKGSWFFNGLLGFDPDNEEDIAKVQAIQDTYQSLASQAQSITGGLMNLSRQRRDQEIADLEAKAAKEGMTNDQLLKQKEAITKKYQAEERKLKNIQKAMSISQAIISTAEGAAKALAMGPIIGPIMAAFITALGLAQVGIIKAQKFAFGGIVRGPGGPKDDKIPAMLSNGEYIIRAEATERYRPLLDAINFGRSVSVQPRAAYADGGVVSGGIDFGKKMDTLINQVNVLNMNLVKKDMKPVLNISGSVRDMLRVQDKSRVRMEDLGYDPNYA